MRHQMTGSPSKPTPEATPTPTIMIKNVISAAFIKFSHRLRLRIKSFKSVTAKCTASVKAKSRSPNCWIVGRTKIVPPTIKINSIR